MVTTCLLDCINIKHDPKDQNSEKPVACLQIACHALQTTLYRFQDAVSYIAASVTQALA